MTRIQSISTCLASILTYTIVAAASADQLTLTSGRILDGEVLQDDPGSIVFRLDHGVINVPRDMVKAIDHQERSALTTPVPMSPAIAAARIPTWRTITSMLATLPWATNLKEIPATVISKGQMRYVPCSSYRCGEDYEVNVYGDPNAPAAIEIGVYRRLLTDASAKQNCLTFMRSVLGDKVDAAILADLDQHQDLVLRRGMTTEVTPETAEDAYGGWWISVYDEKLLDSARATPAEIVTITVP